MAYTPIQPNSGTQTGDPYKAAIEGSIGTHARIAAMFAPHEQDTPDMTVRLDAGHLLVNVTLSEIAAQNTGTITAPTGSDHRIDRVVIDALTGVVSVITGTPGAPPRTPPAITTGKRPICQIALAHGMTVITNDLITDERVMGGGEGEAVQINGIYQNLGVDPATELGYGTWLARDTICNIVALLHFEGTTITFADDGPRGLAITRGGAATQSTTQKKFGSKSLECLNNADYISVAGLTNLIQPVTLDFWAYVYWSGRGDHPPILYWDSQNWIWADLSTGTITAKIGGVTQTFGAILNNIWAHIELVFLQNALRIAVNGTFHANAINGYAALCGFSQPLLIGGNGSVSIQGYIDEFRIKNGGVVADFTPPIAAYDLGLIYQWLRTA